MSSLARLRRARPGLPVILFVPLLVLSLLSCSDDETDPTTVRDEIRSQLGLKSPGPIPYPPNNPAIQERVSLGRLLFFDPILSGNHDVSCGTCHHPAFAWGDGLARAIGVSGELPGVGPEGVGPGRVLTDPLNFIETPRNSPTCLNAGCSSQPGDEMHHMGPQFWDGRADGLENQAKLPITSFDEMAGGVYVADDAMDVIVDRLRDIPEYVQLFREAFPEEADEMDQWPDIEARHVIREDTYARAIAAYERELITFSSAFDRYVSGDDWALNEDEFEGLQLFFGKAECGGCHSGPMLSTFEYLVTGVPHAGPGRDPRGGVADDEGRYEHTEDPLELYAFRVPSLRNTALTGPWFRAGQAESLREVMAFYNGGGNTRGLEPWRIDARIKPLGLSNDEIDLILAFLESLSDTTIDSPLLDPTVPLTVPSGLSPPEPLAPFSRVTEGE